MAVVECPSRSETTLISTLPHSRMTLRERAVT